MVAVHTLAIASVLIGVPPRSGVPVQVQGPQLLFPGALKREALLGGNPLATYAEILKLEAKYKESPVFAQIYPEIRLNFEQFLGFPHAGAQAMSLPAFRRVDAGPEKSIPSTYAPEIALRVIEREAKNTRIVIWGEEHHLPQTRSLYEATLRALWRQGFRYLAAEAFDDTVMAAGFQTPDYQSGYYLMDPVFAEAVRVAKALGYRLIAYDTKERGEAGDISFRDRTQAHNIFDRVFKRDPKAKVFIVAGRGHAAEEPANDGWTPMASVLKRLTRIDPLTIYAPTMSERSTPREEDPFYRYATARRLVDQPTIFVDPRSKRLFGTSSFDAYIFWPRVRLKNGRPDWMAKTLQRKPTQVADDHSRGTGIRLLQAFREGDPAAAIPVDQVLISRSNDRPILMLPPGRFWLRTIDPEGNVLAKSQVAVRP